MVALDGSENSFSALRKALQLAKPEDSILLVHTIEDIRPARVRYILHPFFIPI